MSDKNDESGSIKPTLIVIKRVKKGGHGHHGGAWKIAYADFVTAMMAFFLLMWLVSSVNKSKLEGIAEYFKQPVKVFDKGGDGLGEGKPTVELQAKSDTKKAEVVVAEKVTTSLSPEMQMQEDELAQLENLKKKIETMLETNPDVSNHKEQINFEITGEGLRIQVIDKENRPMFASGSDELELEMIPIFKALANMINEIPNKISIIGHTDGHEFNSEDNRKSNWELSSNRANAARRELENQGVPKNKFLRIMGYSSSILLDPKNPFNSKNRRVSIVIMKDHITQDVIKQNL